MKESNRAPGAAVPGRGKRESGCGTASDDPAEYFENMIDNCLDYAEQAKSQGRPVVGIMCEFAPRELILAAGAVPVCLCGGSNRTIPAAEQHLPANLCPLIKSTYGYHVTGSNPFLAMADLVVGETTCDGKKKMFELMAETKPLYVMELPPKAEDPDAFDYWLSELHKLKAHLEDRLRVRITEDAIRQAIRVMNRERALRRALAGLMASDNPALTGRRLLEFRSIISGIPRDLEQYEALLRHYSGAGVTTNGSSPVRVLLTGVPTVHGAERIVDIIEDSGGLIVAAENCTGLKPILEDVDEDGNVMLALAKKYFRLPCSVMTRNSRRLECVEQLARDFRAECVIDLVWQACLTYDVESFSVRRLVEQRLGVPYLRIETDYSPSDSARVAVRVEALYETARAARKTPREASGCSQRE